MSHVPISGLFDLMTLNMYHVLRSVLGSFSPSGIRSICLFLTYNVFTADTLVTP